MKVTIESTETIVEVDGVPARVWTGRSESGIGVEMLVVLAGVDQKDAGRVEEFERDLRQHAPPIIDWPRMVALSVRTGLTHVDVDADADDADDGEDNGPDGGDFDDE